MPCNFTDRSPMTICSKCATLGCGPFPSFDGSKSENLTPKSCYLNEWACAGGKILSNRGRKRIPYPEVPRLRTPLCCSILGLGVAAPSDGNWRKESPDQSSFRAG